MNNREPPRGRRAKLQEKNSRLDNSLGPVCVRNVRRQEREPSESQSNLQTSPPPVTQRSTEVKREVPTKKFVRLQNEEKSPPVIPYQNKEEPKIPQPEFVIYQPKTAYEPEPKCNKYEIHSEHTTKTSRHVDGYKIERHTDSHGRVDSIHLYENKSSKRKLVEPPRYFRHNLLSHLEHLWDVGDTTSLEFKLAEPCITATQIDVRAFKLWRYWCQNFMMDCTVGDLVLYIDRNIDVPYQEYRLAAVCGGRKEEIVPADWFKSLRCLLLYPKATILILPRQCTNVSSLFIKILWISVFPFIFLLSVLKCSLLVLLRYWRGLLI